MYNVGAGKGGKSGMKHAFIVMFNYEENLIKI